MSCIYNISVMSGSFSVATTIRSLLGVTIDLGNKCWSLAVYSSINVGNECCFIFFFFFLEKLWILLLDDAFRFWTIYFAIINIYLLRTVFSAHMALLHWQPMPHQHIIIFWVNLFKAQNKLISHSTTWIGLTWLTRSLLQEVDSWSTFPLH